MCGKYGHRAQFCWEDEKNAARRPSFWKPKETPKPKEKEPEMSAVAIDDSKVEYLLSSIDTSMFGNEEAKEEKKTEDKKVGESVMKLWVIGSGEVKDEEGDDVEYLDGPVDYEEIERMYKENEFEWMMRDEPLTKNLSKTKFEECKKLFGTDDDEKEKNLLPESEGESVGGSLKII
jgi:hypothetical protein